MVQKNPLPGQAEGRSFREIGVSLIGSARLLLISSLFDASIDRGLGFDPFQRSQESRICIEPNCRFVGCADVAKSVVISMSAQELISMSAPFSMRAFVRIAPLPTARHFLRRSSAFADHILRSPLLKALHERMPSISCLTSKRVSPVTPPFSLSGSSGFEPVQ